MQGGPEQSIAVHPEAGSARVLRRSAFADAAWIDELAGEAWRRASRVIKADARSSVMEGRVGGARVVVKSLRLGGPADVLKRLLRVTRLERQWRGAELLAARNVPAAGPLLLWRGRDTSGVLIESLVMEHVEGRTMLSLLRGGGLSEASMRQLARAAGEQAAMLASMGLVNRDHKPSNLLVMSDAARALESGEARALAPGSIAILDTVAIRRAPPIEARRSMLFSLLVEPIGVGAAPSPLARRAAVRAAARENATAALEDWRAVATRLKEHGDPTPAVDPTD